MGWRSPRSDRRERRGGPVCQGQGDRYWSPPRLPPAPVQPALSRWVLGSAERAHCSLSDQVLLFLLLSSLFFLIIVIFLYKAGCWLGRG